MNCQGSLTGSTPQTAGSAACRSANKDTTCGNGRAESENDSPRERAVRLPAAAWAPGGFRASHHPPREPPPRTLIECAQSAARSGQCSNVVTACGSCDDTYPGEGSAGMVWGECASQHFEAPANHARVTICAWRGGGVRHSHTKAESPSLPPARGRSGRVVFLSTRSAETAYP
eukprot:scaffold8877_cov112-Isochrysis_galbana.AAC.11